METKRMEKTSLPRNTTAFGLSLALASIVNAALVVAKESSPAHVMVWMKGMTGHHWTTHAAIVLTVFVAGGFLFRRMNAGRGVVMRANGLAATIVGSVLGSSVIIGAYYAMAG